MASSSAVATIDVHGQPPAPVESNDADPNIILAGKKTALTWQTGFTDTVSIDNGIGNVGSYGTIEVKLKTTTFTFTAIGLGGSNIVNITIWGRPYQNAHVETPKNITSNKMNDN